MKYYVGSILEVNGGMEYPTKFIVKVDNEEDLDQACSDVAMNWRENSEWSWVEMGYVSGDNITKPFEPDYKIDEHEIILASKYLQIIGTTN